MIGRVERHERRDVAGIEPLTTRISARSKKIDARSTSATMVRPAKARWRGGQAEQRAGATRDRFRDGRGGTVRGLRRVQEAALDRPCTSLDKLVVLVVRRAIRKLGFASRIAPTTQTGGPGSRRSTHPGFPFRPQMTAEPRIVPRIPPQYQDTSRSELPTPRTSRSPLPPRQPPIPSRLSTMTLALEANGGTERGQTDDSPRRFARERKPTIFERGWLSLAREPPPASQSSASRCARRVRSEHERGMEPSGLEPLTSWVPRSIPRSFFSVREQGRRPDFRSCASLGEGAAAARFDCAPMPRGRGWIESPCMGVTPPVPRPGLFTQRPATLSLGLERSSRRLLPPTR